MTNAKPPADAAQREEALDPARSFIVQAPAGSGKTELLIQRYLRLLATVGEPEEIVAITFTRKAAGEMRNRVLDALRRAEAGVAPQTAHETKTQELARAALARDGERRWALPQNPARLRIQTIDSLCASLARQMPLLSRFAAHLEPTEQAYPLYREAARGLLAQLEERVEWSPALESLLAHRDNELGKIEDLLADMLARRDQWLRHIAGSKSAQPQRDVLEAGLQILIREALEDARQHLPRALEKNLLNLAYYAAANLVADGRDSPVCACDGLETVPEAGLEAMERWLGLAELLLTKNGNWRAACDARIGFPPADKKEPTYKAQKDAIKALLEDCLEHDDWRARLHALRSLPPAHYNDEQWAILQALFTLLPIAAAELELIFQKRSQVDFSGVARRALDALGAPDAPTDLALALDYRIRHVLIDEFQDTSLSQSQLLEGLTAGWQAGDGRTLFAVGDPMQSIYGFREAEVGVFLQARRAGIGGIDLAPLTLSVNFRSQQGIVDWINTAFQQVFPPVEDIAAGAVGYCPCESLHPALDGTAAQMHCFIGKDLLSEAERVVDLIRQAQQPRGAGQAQAENPAGAVAVLVRSKTHLAEIVPRLKAAGMSFRAVEIDALGDRPTVQDLLALTRALCHPADRPAWLAVLRAPWCGLTLHDLHALAGDDHHRSLWDLMTDDTRCERLSADGQRRLASVRAVFKDCLTQRRRRTLRRRVEGAWLALGGPATVSDAADLENAAMVFALLEELDGGGDLVDFAALEEGVQRLFAAPDPHADDRLQIMTIHKAKGLEFDTVIVPGLGRPPRSDSSRLFNWLERSNRRGGADLLIGPISASESDDKDPIYAAIGRLIASKTQHEDERLLYVACTRARRRLHLLGHASLNKKMECHPARRSLLYALWPAVGNEFAQAAARPAEAAASDEDSPAIIPKIRRFRTEWRLPAPPPSVDWAGPGQPFDPREDPEARMEFFWAGETARHIGTVVHRMLQRIARDGLGCWDASRVEAARLANCAALTALGVPLDELDDAVERVEQILLNALNDPRGRWLLGATQEADSELALSGVCDGQVISIVIDRTFVDENGARWIVDFKTGRHEGAAVEQFLDREMERYRDQLRRYASLMRAGDSRPIRLGLYYPLIENGWREWAYE